MRTVLLIDTRTRDLMVAACSATQHPNFRWKLILRKGVELGPLAGIELGTLDMPIIVLMSGYGAQCSGGFVAVHTPQGAETLEVAGGAGFGYEKDETRKGDALRPFRSRLRAVILPSGSQIRRLPTHANSNSATAKAARQGMALLGQTKIVIAEGQSDRAQGWVIETSGAALPEFPVEHRNDVFTVEQEIGFCFEEAFGPCLYRVWAAVTLAIWWRDHQLGGGNPFYPVYEKFPPEAVQDALLKIQRRLDPGEIKLKLDLDFGEISVAFAREGGAAAKGIRIPPVLTDQKLERLRSFLDGKEREWQEKFASEGSC
ncbi:MAG: hypothetical protein KDD69_06520 [Bdellovibrionales bacterium]|nr:hypothetical protein [Bdellovibrionales bacterium]